MKRTRTTSPWKQCPTVSKHCPSCWQGRPVKQLGEVVVRGQLLEAWQCTEPACELIWCLPPRQPSPVLAAA
ncbi:hypothetical protein [Kitasatospora sp. NBC_01302]|uniref:hypothetical protein n=1 Tax=Kitasatospora sp. NBC_01302 TaxID=2903575 RepID=UPI002E160DC2|nr:hypothetical protein OG294_27730 [Kitasatospora sp. NBC_01302]